MSESWRPCASIDTLRHRASIIQNIRQFFLQRGVLEVETPQLSRHTITDPYLEALQTQHRLPGAKVGDTTTLYLQTSPEYAMKRLLAAEIGDIYQIAKAFRDDEVGRFHNPEFTMLEWYRVGFDMQSLIQEVADLLIDVLKVEKVEQSTYAALFDKFCGINPHSVSMHTLERLCDSYGLSDYRQSCREKLSQARVASDGLAVEKIKSDENELLKDALLQVIFNQKIEPKIGGFYPMVVSHFPITQASLAVIDSSNNTAKRFEVYFKGVELANGFEELRNSYKQRNRFDADNQKRQVLKLDEKAIDERFISALEHGLPPCSGVALGVDRLLMLALSKSSIQEVLSFSYDNC